MASWDFTTTASVLLFTPSKAPIYTVQGGRSKNVVSGETIGGKVRSETRGADRRTLILTWMRITLTDAQAFDTWFATYGANAAAFKIEVPAGALPNVTAATKVTVRCPMRELKIPWIAYGRYTPDPITLIEDL